MKHLLINIAVKIFKKYDILIFKEIDHRISNDLHFYDIEIDLNELKNNIYHCLDIGTKGEFQWKNRYKN